MSFFQGNLNTAQRDLLAARRAGLRRIESNEFAEFVSGAQRHLEGGPRRIQQGAGRRVAGRKTGRRFLAGTVHQHIHRAGNEAAEIVEFHRREDAEAGAGLQAHTHAAHDVEAGLEIA